MYPKISVLEQELMARLKEHTGGNARAMSATIITLSSKAHAEEVDRWTESLMGRRPARLLHLRGYAPDGLHSWSSARCALDRQERGICFEDVYIETPDDSAYQGRIWSALVLRELPALLVWTLGPEALNSCEYDCAERVDLTIINGSWDLKHYKRGLAVYRDAVASALQSNKALVDLSWEQLLPLRYAFSRLFDAPHTQDIDLLRTINIQVSDPWTLHLLKGWIQDRTKGKSIQIDGRLEPSYQDGTGQISCTFADGTLSAIEVHTSRQAELRYRDGKSLQISLPDASIGAILERIVDSPVADPLYKRAL
ncbi:glucose-6-phosphate dehydrogenase assembly protein OpcA [Gracilinema caldarium]|uniref:glucose-6-phosphate dehydrogenase assembly protein OpcA n=1 Tax=Gracilinema caldarium TaxID=215591 RepID=UPI0026ED1FBE|nr:glucose-6-phosphate dehydrogenase assembly protein OpcA [Gracilinema caldarium]